MTEERTIKLKQTIRAERERVFAALTDAIRLREWMCDYAWTTPRTGGGYALRWNSGYQAQGTFVEVDPPEELAMIWQGIGEPGPTLVKWELEEEDGATEVELEHIGFGSGPEWDATYAEAEKGWRGGLENLQSVLEEGIDLRELRRPFLGVMFDQLTPKMAEEEEIAAEAGIYVVDPIEGEAASEAGIQKGDVITAIGDYAVQDLATLVRALQAHQTGDTVPIQLVRGQEELTVEAALKERKPPEVPEDPAEAAAQLGEGQAEMNQALREATEGLSEEEAGQQPEEGEWSVKEVLAHLSHSERGFQSHLFHQGLGFVMEGHNDSDDWMVSIDVVLEAEPTLEGLLDRFAQDQEETRILVEKLGGILQDDPYRRRLILQLPFNSLEHTKNHIQQIQKTVEAVTETA